MASDLMIQLPGVRPAPYFARAHWVAVGPDAPLSEADVCDYLREAHRLIASKLTRKLRASVGFMA
jgi:predicted DNA-binding protein (MmcQ/YjbR family)